MNGKKMSAAAVMMAMGGLAVAAEGFTFTMTPVTVTTPNFAGPILINGTVGVGVGETFIPATVMSSQIMPFLSNFSAGFNGTGQGFDPGFLAWNGVGVYSGPIYRHQVSANNLGYSGGMPLGLYDSNPLGPGGKSGLILHFSDETGRTQSAVAMHAVRVVPAPGVMGLAAAAGMLAFRRRR